MFVPFVPMCRVLSRPYPYPSQIDIIRRSRKQTNSQQDRGVMAILVLLIYRPSIEVEKNPLFHGFLHRWPCNRLVSSYVRSAGDARILLFV
jgi:hypothetical protein